MKAPPLFGLLLLVSGFARGQTIGWFKFAGGGGLTTEGQFTVTGTIGQHDAARAVAVAAGGGDLSLAGGFWARSGLLAGTAVPVARPDAIVRRLGATVAKVPLHVLLANDSDADGDPLAIVAVGEAQPAGATVAIAGDWVIYAAPEAGAGVGSFRYTLTDGTGHNVLGLVSVTGATPPDPGTGPNAVAVFQQGADITVSFLGVPGQVYRVQFSTDTAPPYAWQDFSPPADHIAPENGAVGVFNHTDVAPPEALRLYRAILKP